MINTAYTLIAAMLILIVSLFSLEMALAEITIDGETVHVETNAYTVQFDRGVITQLHNKLTAETYTLPLGTDGTPAGRQGQTGILRTRNGNIYTRESILTEARKITPLKAEILFRQGGNEIRLSIAVEPNTGDLLIEQAGISETAGVYGLQWGCGGLDIRNLDLILPADGGQVINASSPITNAGGNYPGLWEAQLAIMQGERGGFYVRGADETFQFKKFNASKDSESLELNFQTHKQAPWDTLTTAQSVVWRLNTYAGDWRVPAQIYRDWMERTFNPWRLSDMPAWVQDIGLVVIYGPLDTEPLDRLAELVDPTKTLLYLVGWRKGGHDANYPDYIPRDGFGDFVKTAHTHGFRVMPHANLVGLSPYHPLYPEFQAFQFRDPWSEEPIGWKWDEIANPGRHAWINNASSKFRNLLVQQLKGVWEKYRVDAFHLDISHVVVNDANGLIEGLNSAQGNVLMHQQLAEAMPGVAFSGEWLHEVTFFRESFAQRRSAKATPHPISAFIFSPYTRSYGHLGLPSLENNPVLYHNFLNSYEGWGILPTVQTGSISELNGHLTQQMLAVARQWQELGLRPDFESDWGAETLFQYTTQSGETVTYQRTPAGSTFILPQDGGYERVYGVTEVQTHRSLPHWRAYNETTILGLDPSKYYFLDNTHRDFSQPHINSLPLGISVTETRVTENAAVFRLEQTNVSLEIDLLSKLHLARTGIVVNGTELPLQRGGTFRYHPSTISGVTISAIHAHPFYQGGSGDTFGEFTLTLPDSPDIRLQFYIGLWEGSQNSDGVTFVVSVQDDEIFHQHYNQQKWEPVALDLSSYRGELAKLRFTTTPGPNGDAGRDWAVWGEPKIISKPDYSVTKVGFFSPVEPTGSLPDTLSHIDGGHYSLETVLPAQTLFFLTPGQQVVPPYNLRDAQFTAGLQFDSIFRLGSVWNSGSRSTVENPNGERKPSIFAPPPTNGKTILQFPLLLPEEPSIFSFSVVLQEGCSTGVLFQVLLNGQPYFEHFTDTFNWTEASLSLSEFAGQPLLLELVTDPAQESIAGANCDWVHWADLHITAAPNPDANLDGQINILDLILVTGSFGEQPPSNPQADVNKDGVVNLLDLVFIAESLSQNAAAPAQMDTIKSIPRTAKEIIAAQRALSELEAIPNKSQGVQLVIELLRHYLSIAELNVEETKLLPNYPNPFNPETWIPYQLSEESTVTVKIYDVRGHLVRTIEVGHKPMGYYLTRERAIYWDGRNETGERISSGVYFYILITGHYTQTRRMVIVK